MSSCTRLTVQQWVLAAMVCKPLSWKASVLVSSVFELLLGAQMRVAGLGLHLCASLRLRVQGGGSKVCMRVWARLVLRNLAYLQG